MEQDRNAPFESHATLPTSPPITIGPGRLYSSRVMRQPSPHHLRGMQNVQLGEGVHPVRKAEWIVRFEKSSTYRKYSTVEQAVFNGATLGSIMSALSSYDISATECFCMYTKEGQREYSQSVPAGHVLWTSHIVAAGIAELAKGLRLNENPFRQDVKVLEFHVKKYGEPVRGGIFIVDVVTFWVVPRPKQSIPPQR